MKCINYLKNVLQNYIQYDIKLPMVISSNVFDSDNLVIWTGDMNQICISTIDEYNFNCLVSDHDYRVNLNNKLFETTDINLIQDIIDVLFNYYQNGYNYEITISSLINKLENNKVLKK